ncbi:hypothetical protein JCM10207_003470 [Rhodosporidiobolus poonsookiae]
MSLEVGPPLSLQLYTQLVRAFRRERPYEYAATALFALFLLYHNGAAGYHGRHVLNREMGLRQDVAPAHHDIFSQLNLAGCGQYFHMAARNSDLEPEDHPETFLTGSNAVSLARELGITLRHAWDWFNYLRAEFGLERLSRNDPYAPRSPRPSDDSRSTRSPSASLQSLGLAHNRFRPESRRNFASSFLL